MENDTAATQAHVQNALDTAVAAAVSVKLPPFWPDKTELWFAQAEAQFTIKNITAEKTKYAYVVTMLDSQMAAQAMDIIRTPPEAPYTALKARLTKAFYSQLPTVKKLPKFST
jgi:heptaprenylglyceryl phosphate synthase